jgi:hypothetical protein
MSAVPRNVAMMKIRKLVKRSDGPDDAATVEVAFATASSRSMPTPSLLRVLLQALQWLSLSARVQPGLR